MDNPVKECIARYNEASTPRERIVNDILIRKSDEDRCRRTRYGNLSCSIPRGAPATVLRK